jgi:hypothetical protein
LPLTLPLFRYRVLLDAASSPSTDLAALKSFEAHLLYIQSHFNLRAMSLLLQSEKTLPKESETGEKENSLFPSFSFFLCLSLFLISFLSFTSFLLLLISLTEVLSAIDRSTFLRSSFVCQYATELLANRGALIASEKTDPAKILLRLVVREENRRRRDTEREETEK